MRVTISGPPGSGKTTVAQAVAKSLKFKLILTGQVFREQAKKAGMDVHTYNRLAETDPSIDERLDNAIIQLAMKTEKSLVEGRLAAHLFQMRKIPSFKVYITAPVQIRADRIAKREKTTKEIEMKKLGDRERSEKSRYKSFYGVDIEDMSVYDLVIDSSDITADEAARIVVSEIRKLDK